MFANAWHSIRRQYGSGVIRKTNLTKHNRLITTIAVKKMAYKVERVTDVVKLGEGPHWDVETQVLYYVDLIGNSIHKFKPSTNEHSKLNTSVSSSFIIPLEGTKDKFVTSMEQDIAIITWDGVGSAVSNIEKIAVAEDTKDFKNRWNDAKAAPNGTLWGGTLASAAFALADFPKAGRLHSLNKNRTLKCHVSDIQISNGLAWNADLGKFYFIDSAKRTIDQFDFDAKNESISNRTSIFSLEKHNITGFPDGQAIDTDGNLWVALFDGAKVIKIDPRIPDTLLQTIDIPAKKVTSVAFGGKDLDELYVTTAGFVSEGEAPPTDADGATYRITGLGVKGFGGIPVKL